MCVCVCNSTAFYPRSLAYSLSAILILCQLFRAIEILPSSILRQLNIPTPSIASDYFYSTMSTNAQFYGDYEGNCVWYADHADYIRMRERQTDGAYLIRESEIEFVECEASLYVSLLIDALLIRDHRGKRGDAHRGP